MLLGGSVQEDVNGMSENYRYSNILSTCSTIYSETTFINKNEVFF